MKKRLVFDGSADVLKYIQKHEDRVREFLDGHHSFAKKSYEEICNGLKFGIKDYNKKFLEELKDIEDTKIETNDYFFTDNGMFYDMQSVVDGLPECMLDTVQEERKSLRIVSDYAYPHYVSDKRINYRGVSLFKLFYTLLTKNYNLEIEFATKIIHRGRTRKELELIFRLPKNELNIPTIAYYCNVEFFRAVTCAILETEGLRTNCSQSDRDFCSDNPEDFFVPAGYTDSRTETFNSVEDADKYITEKFNKYLEQRGMK